MSERIEKWSLIRHILRSSKGVPGCHFVFLKSFFFGRNTSSISALLGNKNASIFLPGLATRRWTGLCGQVSSRPSYQRAYWTDNWGNPGILKINAGWGYHVLFRWFNYEGERSIGFKGCIGEGERHWQFAQLYFLELVCWHPRFWLRSGFNSISSIR